MQLPPLPDNDVFGASDLAAIYAADPEARVVEWVRPDSSVRLRTRGFVVAGTELRRADTGDGDAALRVPVGAVLLTVRAGTLGEVPPDAVLQVDGVRYRVVGESSPVGDGLELDYLLVPLSPSSGSARP